jgi:IclR family pca regulon transcriptional regulator
MAKLREQDARRRAESGRGPDFSEALARGLGVLASFGAERRPMTLSEVARAVDLPRATARRALHTLAELGFVAEDGRLFRLTPKVLSLAGAYLLSNAVSTVLQPAVDRLSAELNETVTAAVLDGEEVVMIAHAAPQRLVAAGGGIGFRLPAFCTALGRVLLAAEPQASLDLYLGRLRPARVTPATVVDKAALRQAILAVREAGHALVDGEAEVGYRSLAVPIRRFDGTVVAAMNVGMRVEQAMVEAMRQAYLPRLTGLAAELGPLIL